MPNYNILCIHGIGHAEVNKDWNQPWIDVLKQTFEKKLHSQYTLTFSALAYDNIFEKYPSNAAEDVEAVAELLGSAAYHAAVDPLQARAFEPLENLKYVGRWFAGMVAQWIVCDDLRKELRADLTDKIQQFQPDIILAHSLGTLLSYDLFTYDNAGRGLAKGRVYVTFGAQIANTFVRARMWGGRIPMVNAKRWYHLFNKLDPAFTAPISEPGQPDFFQIETDTPAGHNPTAVNDNPGYLDHPNTLTKVWEPLSRGLDDTLLSRGYEIVTRATKSPVRRALLVGINQYPDPAHKLEGCVNDVYSISAVLQENGFEAAEICVLLDERATRDAIIDRLQWLLSHTDDKADRVFYYSGHGVAIPGLGRNGVIDHLEDGMVPVDFDWRKLNAITDKDLFALYSQLPELAKFLCIFDCCFSGGLVKDAQGRVRSLPVPPEMRHSLQEWDSKARRWRSRQLNRLLPDWDAEKQRAYTGSNGTTYKIGRAVPLRRVAHEKFKELTELREHHGPYLPIVIEACRDNQLSYEHVTGAVTHGAFTYALVSEFKKPAELSFRKLEARVTRNLKGLGLDQHPQIVGPKIVLENPIIKWGQADDKLVTPQPAGAAPAIRDWQKA